MKRSVIVLLSAILSTGVASLASAQTKIGIVNVQRLVDESPQGKAVREELRNEFEPKFKEIETKIAALRTREEKLKKDEATMTEVQKAQFERELQSSSTDLRRRQSAFDDEYNAARQDAQEKLLRVLDEEVKAFAKAQGYDLILTEAAFATPTLDVTGAILQALAKRPAAAAPAAPASTPSAPPANRPPPSISKP